MTTIITETNDIISDLVIEWLRSNAVDCKRYNSDTSANNSISLQDEKTAVPSGFKHSKVVWNRRAYLKMSPYAAPWNEDDHKDCHSYLLNDALNVAYYTEHFLSTAKNITLFGSLSAELNGNKLINLSLARKAGLNIPDTLVTNEKKQLVTFLKKHRKVITKDLKAPVNINVKDGKWISAGATLILEEEVRKLPVNFYPVLAQRYTEKQFEIRTFIFDQALFSMAIFSQNDEQTATDFRNYNDARPNRCVPFRLPDVVSTKLLQFMKLANLNTGSIDLIYTPEGEYVFLEVNPMGQFHWLSENCNYYLERFIANHLAKN